MKRILAALLAPFLFLTLFFLPAFAGTINPPTKGFDKQVYDASYALLATSVERNHVEPRFLCTVTAVQKFSEGYLFLGAGHCTTVNPDLPDDLKFFIATDVGKAPRAVELLTAKMTEDFESEQTPIEDPLDYAVFYLKTTDKITIVGLGDEGSVQIGSPTLNVNFSKGQAKYVSPGIVDSTVEVDGVMKGFFGVQMFASHGASGSAVIDPKTKKIIGVLIAGNDGETLPNWIEPISHIEAALSGVDFNKLIVKPEIPNVERPDRNLYHSYGGVSLFSRQFGSHGGAGGSGKSSNSHSGSRPNQPLGSRPQPPRHEPPSSPREPERDHGRSIHPPLDRRHFGREHAFRPEIVYNGGIYSFYYAGFWFNYEDQWPAPCINGVCIGDVYIDMDADGVYWMYRADDARFRIQVWIP